MVSKRPKKPKLPVKPAPPSKTLEKWELLWKLSWPSDFSEEEEDGLPLEGTATLEEFRKKMPPQMWDPLCHEEDLRVAWKGTIDWEYQEIELRLEQRSIVPNPKYDGQLKKFEVDVAKHADLMVAYEEATKAWEKLNKAYDEYESSVANPKKS
jgi:hypothetical protein